MPKVLITQNIPRSGINILEQYKEIELVYLEGREIKAAIKDADVLITGISDTIDEKVINASNKLKLISTYSVGYDHINVDYAASKGIHVSHTPGNLTEAVGEHCLALMLALGRQVVASDRALRKGKYDKWNPVDFMGTKFMGKTLGIIGMGRIGQYFARMAKYGLAMDIIYTDIVEQVEAQNLLDAKRVPLEELLTESDIVSINTRLTKETRHMLGDPEFRKMKPMALLINTARGEIVNEEALVSALEEGIIAGAALDVFENEPHVHPKLRKMDNVVITSHIGSATREARIQMARMVAESVIDVIVNKTSPRYAIRKALIEREPVGVQKEEIVSLV